MRKVVTLQLLGIDVDANQTTVDPEVTVEDGVIVGLAKLCADGQYHVRLSYQLAHRVQGLGGAQRQWMTLRQ